MRFSHLLLLSVAAVASMDVVQAEGLRGQHRALKEGKEDKGGKDGKEKGGKDKGEKDDSDDVGAVSWDMTEKEEDAKEKGGKGKEGKRN